MERTDEFLRATKIYANEGKSDEGEGSGAIAARELTQHSKTALRVSIYLADNEKLVRKMEILTGRKEFSNDPTQAMSEISAIFQKNMSSLQNDMTQLKKYTETNSSANMQQQHYKIILQSLNKKVAEHVDQFKQALKTHSDHVQQRQQRVVKYGQGQDQLRAASAVSMEATQSYAMFSSKLNHSQGNTSNTSRHTAEHQKSQELRRRVGGQVGENAAPSGPPRGTKSFGVVGSLGGGLMQEQMTRQRDSQGLRSAQKVEAAIAQMGELFTQMASLVLEQGETLARIEDDVEVGLQNTEEAHQSMTQLYDITKGNRGMILKIFLLLIFFIFLFLVWT